MRKCEISDVGCYWDEWLIKRDLDTDKYWDNPEGGVEEFKSLYYAHINNAEDDLICIMESVEHCANAKDLVQKWKHAVEEEIGEFEKELKQQKRQKPEQKLKKKPRKFKYANYWKIKSLRDY